MFRDKINNIYIYIEEVCKNETIDIRNKYCMLWTIQQKFFDIIIEQQKTSNIYYTAQSKYIKVIQNSNYKLSQNEKNIFHRFHKKYTLILKNLYNPNENDIINYKNYLCWLIFCISGVEVPETLLDIEEWDSKHKDLFPEDNLSFVSDNEALIITLIKKISETKGFYVFVGETYDSIVKILSKNNLLESAWIGSKIALYNLIEVNPEELNDQENKILIKNNDNIGIPIKYYKTQQPSLTTLYNTTIAVLQPDFLIDVSDITSCYCNSKVEFPIFPIIQKFFYGPATKELLKGNIINELFDLLLMDINCNFSDSYALAVDKHKLETLVVLSNDQNNINISAWRKYIKSVFDILQREILDNYSNSINYIEPSFESYDYGLQGRLDLMTVDNNNINIVELKSGKAPNSANVIVKIGIKEKKELALPLWINHYIQIICYNILLNANFGSDRQGESSILYANTDVIGRLRNVLDNGFVQCDIIEVRNWIVRYYYELAKNKNLSIFRINNFIQELPSYLQDRMLFFINRLNSLSKVEQEYLKEQISFVAKELFSNKIGMFTDNNIEKFGTKFIELNNESCITNLLLLEEESDIKSSRLVFKRENINSIDSFRIGDSCKLYVAPIDDDINNKEELIRRNLLLRGSIVDIDQYKIVVILRNKFTSKISLSKNKWLLTGDYTSKGELFSSIGRFMLNDFNNKQYILGLKEPKFIANSIIDKYIDSEEINDIGTLTDKQKNILKRALSSQNYYLVQGPPGTGKTSYILRCLVKTLENCTNENILLLANTNRAVDEICKAITKIRSNLSFIKLGKNTNSIYSNNCISTIKYNELEQRIKNTRIFVSTVASAQSSDNIFELKFFDTIIIDEATQILEAAIIGLLSHAKRFIMIGDEKQLPAISTLSEANLQICNNELEKIHLTNVGDSLFERLLRICKANDWNNAYGMLTEQSRMNINIMELANELFYNNKLEVRKGMNVHKGNIKFYDIKYYSQTPKINTEEAKEVVKIVKKIINEYKMQNKTIGSDTIGIISPWRLQCNEIYKYLEQDEKLKELLEEINLTENKKMNMKELILVDTVERFQGSERDIIIYSTATNYKIFLDKLSNSKIIDNIDVDRKLNVAITRAKEQFILLGNKNFLNQNVIYKRLIELIERYN